MPISPAREQAFTILLRIASSDAFADRLLAAHLPRIPAEARARLESIVKGVLKAQASIDKTLATVVSKGIENLPPAILTILRIGCYELLYLDRTPDAAVVFEAVELAKIHGHRGTVGLVNAVLRKIGREGTAAVEANNHPDWLIKLWQEELGVEETESLCRANDTQWATTLRVNTLQTSPQNLQTQLAQSGIETAPAAFAAECLTVLTPLQGKNITELPPFVAGHFYIQDEGQALVARLLDPQPGDTILDLCSAPGGKTTHLAELSKDRAIIVAAESNRRRIALVRENATRLQLHSLRYLQSDGLQPALSAAFNRILVDAPCSGLGTLGRKSDLRWQKGKSEIDHLPPLQRRLLENAAALLKPGGRLVYSTCTVHRTENEALVEEFLRDHPRFKLLPAQDLLPPQVCTPAGYLKTLPHIHHCGGAFAAALELEY
jgi:16S rRNA (cytosine967-C5)-methyltransferase